MARIKKTKIGRHRARHTDCICLETNTPQARSKEPAKTGAERFKQYYENLKKDSLKYQQYLLKKRVACKKIASKTDTDGVKEKKREATRLRVQKFRLKKKLSQQAIDKVVVTTKPQIQADKEKRKLKLKKDREKKMAKPQTQADKEKRELKLKKDRERKKAERAGWSIEKKKTEAEKAKLNRLKRKEKQVNEKQRKETKPVRGTSNRTAAAKIKALQCVKAALPIDPAAAQETVIDLYNHIVGCKEEKSWCAPNVERQKHHKKIITMRRTRKQKDL